LDEKYIFAEANAKKNLIQPLQICFNSIFDITRGYVRYRTDAFRIAG
jgi:hypothetical protein